MKFYNTQQMIVAAFFVVLAGLGSFAVFGLWIVKTDVEKTCEDKGGILVDTSRGSICLIVERAKP